MQQPMKLSVGYAYIMSGEALICTVEDGQPSHALTLTVQDLKDLLATFSDADTTPQPDKDWPSGLLHSPKEMMRFIEEGSLAEAGWHLARLVNFALKVQHSEQFYRDTRACISAFWARCEREKKQPAPEAPPQPAPSISDETIETLLHVIDYYRENAFVMDGSLRDIELESAESWLKSLPSMPPPSVPLEVQQAIDSCLDILQTYHSGNPFLSDPVTSEMEIVRSWRNALSQPRDGETC